MKVITWLEQSGHLPDSAVYDIECAKENVEDSVQEFIEGANQLLASDYATPKVFAERLAMIQVRAHSLRVDLQDIEESLGKALDALPRDVFSEG